MKYSIEKIKGHPWTNDSGWITEIWSLEDEREIEELSLLAKKEGYKIWMDGYKGENRTLVIYKQTQN